MSSNTNSQSKAHQLLSIFNNTRHILKPGQKGVRDPSWIHQGMEVVHQRPFTFSQCSKKALEWMMHNDCECSPSFISIVTQVKSQECVQISVTWWSPGYRGHVAVAGVRVCKPSLHVPRNNEWSTNTLSHQMWSWYLCLSQQTDHIVED